jgi:hypothetical protein
VFRGLSLRDTRSAFLPLAVFIPDLGWLIVGIITKSWLKLC